MAPCTLCGLPTGERPIRDGGVDGEFCCRGCLKVSRVADDVDVDSDGRGDRTTALRAPVESTTPDAGDLETAVLSVAGMHCTTCGIFLETTATETAGIRDAQASYATEMIRLTYDPEAIDRSDLPGAVTGYGYRAVDLDDEGQERSGDGERFLLGAYRPALAVLLAMPVMALYVLFIYPTYLGIYPAEFLFGSTVRTMVFVPLVVWTTLVVLGLGYPIFRSGYVSLAIRRPNVDVLISVAVIAAYVYSLAALAGGSRHVYFDVAVMVLAVVTVGNHVESRVKRRAVTARADLSTSRTETVRLLAPDGSLEEVERAACGAGDLVRVTAGERIPFDGTVVDVEGAATVDKALVTGESLPRAASVGDDVLGGSILVEGSLVVEVGDEASSTLDRLVELLRTVQSSEAGAQRLVNAFALLFVPLVVLVAGLATAFWVATGLPASAAVLVGLSVLVVSCPCSLGIATPLALAAGSGRAAENRTAVLTTNVLERITDSEVVAFDKTGTLTAGEMSVETVDADDPEVVLRRAAAVETRANHPIAEAIRDAAPNEPPDAPDLTVEAFERGPRSVSATVDGRRVEVGHPDGFRAGPWDRPDRVVEAVAATRERGHRPVVVGWDGVARGVVAVRDSPRENWAAVIDALSTDGRRIVVLTGDDERATQWVREHPAVDDVFAGVRPESKEAIVRQFGAEATTTMIGDGTNDAPALARADMGIALEGGTDVAIDAADVVVLDDDLEALPTVFEISRSTRRRIRQNLGWALCYNLVAIPLAVAGLINPLIAAVMMGISSLVVVANSGRQSLPGTESNDHPRHRVPKNASPGNEY